METFENYNYTGGDLGYIGGYIDGVPQQRKIIMTPEIAFQVDVNKNYEFLENYLNRNELDRIKEYIETYNYKLFKNPTLLLLSFIVVKLSRDQKSLDVVKLRQVYSDPNVLPLIKENNISQQDLIRYCRYIILNKLFLTTV